MNCDLAARKALVSGVCTDGWMLPLGYYELKNGFTHSDEAFGLIGLQSASRATT